MKLLYPIKGEPHISQEYGNPFKLYSDYHHGVDFGLRFYKKEDDKTVLAAHEGEVVEVDTKSTGNTYYGSGVQGSSYGVHCVIRFKDGGYTYYSLYGHMQECYIKVGQKVAAGQELGLAGNSGLSTAPHLHFELRKGSNARSKAINPKEFFVEEIEEKVPDWGKESWEWARQHKISSEHSTFDEDGRLMVFLHRLADRIMGWVDSRNKALEEEIEALKKDIEKLKK